MNTRKFKDLNAKFVEQTYAIKLARYYCHLRLPLKALEFIKNIDCDISTFTNLKNTLLYFDFENLSKELDNLYSSAVQKIQNFLIKEVKKEKSEAKMVNVIELDHKEANLEKMLIITCSILDRPLQNKKTLQIKLDRLQAMGAPQSYIEIGRECVERGLFRALQKYVNWYRCELAQELDYISLEKDGYML